MALHLGIREDELEITNYLLVNIILGAIPGGGEAEEVDPEEKAKQEEAERERLEAIAEAEERRKEKHRKMEEERENMRQGIRDKVSRILM